jgi:hypothetical protein
LSPEKLRSSFPVEKSAVSMAQNTSASVTLCLYKNTPPAFARRGELAIRLAVVLDY